MMDGRRRSPDTRIFCDPTAYADQPRWHEAAARLRREAPVAEVTEDGFAPFLALTRHADVLDVSRRNDVFANTADSVLAPSLQNEVIEAAGITPRTLIHMDGEEHRAHRQITADWFKPKATAAWQDDIDRIADEHVARLETLGGRCDLARDILAPYALHVIMSIFGVPVDDEQLMLTLTQGLFGAADPEYLGDFSDPIDLLVSTIGRFDDYFAKLAAERRANPSADLASVIANGQIDGRPLGAHESLWYFIIVATAGHDTTSYSLAGGLEALLREPDQLAELRARPALITSGADEMVRWSSPVRQFLRTAQHDTDVAGVPIAAGERVLLSYPSANRDGTVFADADRFDITRADVSESLAFGFGAHHCLGFQLARREIRSMVPRLLARTTDIELDGTPEWSTSGFVGGVKHLPVRYRPA
jgi:cytochrome P450